LVHVDPALQFSIPFDTGGIIPMLPREATAFKFTRYRPEGERGGEEAYKCESFSFGGRFRLPALRTPMDRRNPASFSSRCRIIDETTWNK
jgi:hypothetical protein